MFLSLDPFWLAICRHIGSRLLCSIDSHLGDLTPFVCPSPLSRLFPGQAEQTYIRQAFEGEYPKLVRLHCDLWTRLQQFAAPPAADGQPQFK